MPCEWRQQSSLPMEQRAARLRAIMGAIEQSLVCGTLGAGPEPALATGGTAVSRHALRLPRRRRPPQPPLDVAVLTLTRTATSEATPIRDTGEHCSVPGSLDGVAVLELAGVGQGGARGTRGCVAPCELRRRRPAGRGPGTAEEPLVYRTLGGKPEPAATAGGMARVLGPVLVAGSRLACPGLTRHTGRASRRRRGRVPVGRGG
jgi:hypothetical protein